MLQADSLMDVPVVVISTLHGPCILMAVTLCCKPASDRIKDGRCKLALCCQCLACTSLREHSGLEPMFVCLRSLGR